MTKKRRTRRALINSVISLLICFSMLLGTTFAWFTDEEKSGVNKIMSGNLDVELTHEKIDGTPEKVTENTVLFLDAKGEEIIWEPGVVAYENLSISNVGNLALKYNLSINVANENATKDGGHKLSEVLRYAVLEEKIEKGATRKDVLKLAADASTKGSLSAFSEVGQLEPGAESQAKTLVIFWEPNDNDVDNLYNLKNESNTGTFNGTGWPTTDGEMLHIDLGINLTATQLEYEYDSFGKDYDGNATYIDAWDGTADTSWHNVDNTEFVITTAEELAGLAEIVNGGVDTFSGDTVTLGSDIDLGNKQWNPIGNSTDGWDTKFNGNFIGNGYTISNLYVTGTNGLGLFGYVGNAAHIEGVNIDGAYVSGNDYVGAVLGTGYLATNCLKNCTVKNATIIATPYWDADKKVYDGGAKAGAVAGYASNGHITGNKAINCTVIAYRDLGGIVGMASAENHAITVSNNTVENVTLSYATVDGAYDGNKPNENMNSIVGRKGGSHGVTESDNTGDAIKEETNVNYTIVSTADDLLALSETKVKGIISFENDIDMSNKTFKSISTNYREELTVLGNGHTVSNMKIESGNNDNTTGQASMFYTYTGSTLNISDLTLKNTTVTADADGSGYAAAVIGYCEGIANLKNVDVVNTTVVGVKSSGMLVGHLSGNLNAEDCDVDGSVTLDTFTEEPDGHYAGEYIGTVATTAILNNCTANVKISGNLKDSNVGTPYGRCLGTLIADGANFVSDSNSLDDAIEEGATEIILGNGNYIIPDSAQGKTLTIIGNGDTVIATQDDGSYEGCDYSLDGSTVTFENITINTDSSTYTGYARLNATYKNCTINGTYTLYGDSVFEDCTFNVTGDVYNIWTWGAPTATFNNCTFNSDGKAMLLYGTVNTKLTLNDCTFNDNGGLTDLKAAVEIGNDYGKSYELIVNNTTVNGYEINDKGINTGTTLWANKNSMGTDKLNVVVDGVDVY